MAGDMLDIPVEWYILAGGPTHDTGKYSNYTTFEPRPGWLFHFNWPLRLLNIVCVCICMYVFVAQTKQ